MNILEILKENMNPLNESIQTQTNGSKKKSKTIKSTEAETESKANPNSENWK